MKYWGQLTETLLICKANSELFLSFTPVADAAVKSYILLITSPNEVIKRSHAEVPRVLEISISSSQGSNVSGREDCSLMMGPVMKGEHESRGINMQQIMRSCQIFMSEIIPLAYTILYLNVT
jgi:hypothetical protein